MKTIAYKPNPKTILEAARIIRGGGLVAFPTETVYGLGANALDPEAVERIFKAKGRPQDNPIIVHIARVEDARKLVLYFPPVAKRLADRFWPGPLTMILPKSKKVPYETTAGLDTVALRMPAHPVALALLKAAKVPVAAPSANVSGRPSPTTAAHVVHDLSGRIDAILDGGPARIGVESTVLDLTSKTPTVLRPGGIGIEELRKVLGKVNIYHAGKSAKRPRAPGMKYRHYAPKAPIILVEGDAGKARLKVNELARRHKRQGKRVRILKTGAASLYQQLRRFDGEDADVIIAQARDEKGLGLAVMNRLRKAATKIVAA